MKSAEIYLELTLDALNVVVARVPKDKSSFLKDDILQDATLMRIQEAGEHLAQLRENAKSYYEEYETEGWHQLIGLRNIISHGYVQVDMVKIWEVVMSDIPQLIEELTSLM